MKNGGGHFAPELGGHFELESGGHFKLELGGQYHWNLHITSQTLKISIFMNPGIWTAPLSFDWKNVILWRKTKTF